MKTINFQSKKSPANWLLISALSLFAFSCSFEELAEPFPEQGECEDTSPGGFLSITVDVDTVLWSSGMNGNVQPGTRINEDDSQPDMIESDY